MDYEALRTVVYKLNEDEQFYKKYYYAKQQEYSLQEFLSTINIDDVLRRHLLVPEIKETIPPRFEDNFFFDAGNHVSITVTRHNRYSPALTHDHTFFELLYVYDGSCSQKISDSQLTLRTGDLCIIPPGIKHSVSVFDDNSVILNILIRKSTLHNIFFNFLNSPNILSAFFLNNIYSENGNDYIVFHTGNDNEIRSGFLWMYWESLNRSLYWDQMISYTLMITFGLLIRNYEKKFRASYFQP